MRKSRFSVEEIMQILKEGEVSGSSIRPYAGNKAYQMLPITSGRGNIKASPLIERIRKIAYESPFYGYRRAIKSLY